MPAKVKTLLLVGSVLCSLGVSAQSPQKERTRDDCSVYDAPPTFEGRMVTIRAVYSPTPFEGDYLLDTECKKGMWFTTPTGAHFGAILTSHSQAKVHEPTFEVIKDKQYEQFIQFAYARTANLEPEWQVTATFKGRLDRSKNFALDESHDFSARKITNWHRNRPPRRFRLQLDCPNRGENTRPTVNE